MKKIIIALLVVLSVFALVSCSSQPVTPTVSTQTVALSTEGKGTAKWTATYAHSTLGYKVWYLDPTTGKYVQLGSIKTKAGAAQSTYNGLEPGFAGEMYLKNSAGKTIGTLEVAIGANYEEVTTASGVTNRQFVSDALFLSVEANDTNSGAWGGELVVAEAMTSDTAFTNMVGKYAVTYTNTIAGATTKALEPVKLAVGGLHNMTATGFVDDNADSAIRDVKFNGTFGFDSYGIFEVLAGGNKFIGDFVDGNQLEIYDADDETVLIGAVTFGYKCNHASAAGPVITFDYADYRNYDWSLTTPAPYSAGYSYRCFADYTYSGNFVIGRIKWVDGVATLDSTENSYTVSLTADNEPFVVKSTNDASPIFGYDATKIQAIKVGDINEKAGIFVKSGAVYTSLDDYYVTGTNKDYAVGLAGVTEDAATAGGLERTLDVNILTEDVPGEWDATKAFGADVTAAVVNAVVCSYTGSVEDDEYVIVKEIANVALPFENELPGHMTLESGVAGSTTYTRQTGDGKKLWLWNSWDAYLVSGTTSPKCYGFWQEIDTDRESGSFNLYFSSQRIVKLYWAKNDTKFTFTLDYCEAGGASGTFYLKFADDSGTSYGIELDGTPKTETSIEIGNSPKNANPKFVVDCTVEKSTPISW